MAGKGVALFGGTFNPIHIGHLVMAAMVHEKLGLRRVVFVPSAIPPHKKIRHLAPAEDRLAMVRLAVEDDPAFEVSDFEVGKDGKSYSIDTVEHYQTLWPREKIFFIIGQDSYPHLHTWKNFDSLIKMVTFVVVNRPGYTLSGQGIGHVSVSMPGLDVSSSYLRTRIRQGKTIRYLTPAKVEAYIRSHRLYQ